jgi:hypothetical protein
MPSHLVSTMPSSSLIPYQKNILPIHRMAKKINPHVPCQIRTGDLRIAYSTSSHSLYETDVITDYTNET